MNRFTRQTAPETARRLAERITAAGVDLPAEVADALDHLEAVERMKPEPATREMLTEAYAAADKKRATMLATAVTAYPAAQEAWTHGRITAGLAVLRTITGCGDRITRALAELAAPLIEQLDRAAQIDTHDLSVLIRNGRTEDADLAARLDLIAANLTELYAIRHKVTNGAEWTVDGIDCGRWRDPRPATQANTGKPPTTHPLEGLLRGLRAGAVLWFPTPGEATERARVIAAEVASEKLAAEAAQWTASGKVQARA